MKTLLLISVWLTSAWTIWGAESTEKYNAKEVSVDLFGSASLSQDVLSHWSRKRVEEHARLGAGVGVNYFHTEYVGVGLETYSENTGHSLLDSASVNLIGRYPIGESGFAPFCYFGIGYQFECSDAKFTQIGAGIEYRFNQKFGVFADARYVITDAAPNYGLGRLGIRVCF